MLENAKENVILSFLIALIIGVAMYGLYEKADRTDRQFHDNLTSYANEVTGAKDAQVQSRLKTNKYELTADNKVYHAYVTKDSGQIRLQYMGDLLRTEE